MLLSDFVLINYGKTHTKFAQNTDHQTNDLLVVCLEQGGAVVEI